MKKIFFYIAVTAVICVVIYIFAAPIAISAFSRTQGLTVSYKALGNNFFREFKFKGLNVIQSKTGLGFAADKAQVIPIFKDGVSIDFNLSDVSFIKNKTESDNSYDSLSGLVYMPFKSHWQYKEINGRIRPSEKGIEIERLSATSEDIKLFIKGNIYGDNKINLDLGISFSEKISANIPKELAEVVLRDEEAGWKGFEVNLSGDLSTPAIQVSGKLFRLNIGTTPAAR